MASAGGAWKKKGGFVKNKGAANAIRVSRMR